MKERLDQIAAALGGTVMPSYSPTSWFIVIGNPAEWESLKLFVMKVLNAADGSVRLSYCSSIYWWEGNALKEDKSYTYRREPPSIGFNLNRPTEVLARDINKRLLDAAKVANEANVVSVKNYMDYDTKVMAFGSEFGTMRKGASGVQVYVSDDYRSRVDLSYIGDTRAVLTVDMPHDIIRKVINYVKEIIND